MTSMLELMTPSTHHKALEKTSARLLQPITRRELLPLVDIDLTRSLLERPTQTDAVRELRARLRDRKPPD